MTLCCNQVKGGKGGNNSTSRRGKGGYNGNLNPLPHNLMALPPLPPQHSQGIVSY